MTDTDRERLARAAEHPLCKEALAREPTDYTVPVLLVGLFYLLLPVLFFLLPLLLLTAGHARPAVLFIYAAFHSIWAWPFLITAWRTMSLRRMETVRALGVSTGSIARKPGKWVRLDRADGPLDLRLRLRAYLDSTGGALQSGNIGVALCKGDQMVEWVRIPEEAPAAAGEPAS